LLEAVVGMLSSGDPVLSAEATWILTNVASGTSKQTAAVVTAGAIPGLVALFPCESMKVTDNALWALGNIGGDSERLRDLVVQEGGVKPMLDVLDAPEKYTPKVVETASDSRTSQEPETPPETPQTLQLRQALQTLRIHHMVPILTKFIRNTKDETLGSFTNVLRALNYISSDETAAEATLATGIAPRLVELCMAEKDDVQQNAVLCVGQFTAGSEASTEAVIQAGFLSALKFCIPCGHVRTRQTACWAASNIAAGSLSQARALFDHDVIFWVLHVISDQEEEIKTLLEASWALSALVSKGQEYKDLLVRLVQANGMEALSSGLMSPDYSTVSVLISSLETALNQPWSGREGGFRALQGHAWGRSTFSTQAWTGDEGNSCWMHSVEGLKKSLSGIRQAS
ncbi:Importin alpha subunit (Karyopherin alpha subunit) (Serine-rich RNA polymerase I suppressor protein), partial [Tulasnella sp. 417]